MTDAYFYNHNGLLLAHRRTVDSRDASFKRLKSHDATVKCWRIGQNRLRTYTPVACATRDHGHREQTQHATHSESTGEY